MPLSKEELDKLVDGAKERMDKHDAVETAVASTAAEVPAEVATQGLPEVPPGRVLCPQCLGQQRVLNPEAPPDAEDATMPCPFCGGVGNVEEMQQVSELDQLALGCLVRWLVNQRMEVKRAFAVMMFSRQLYAVAVKDLLLRLEDIPATQHEKMLELALRNENVEIPAGEKVDPATIFGLVDEALVQTCQHAASQAFREQDLIPAFNAVVKPWFDKVLVEHVKREQEESKLVWEASEKVRVARPVPLGLVYDQERKEALERKKPLFLVGWAPAVAYLLDKITEHVIKAGDEQVYQVVRLLRQLKPNVDSKPISRLVRLGGKEWENVFKARDGMDKLFVNKVVTQLHVAVDLFVIDDACHAAKAGSLALRRETAASAASKAEQVNKALIPFLKKTGSAAVVGVPLANMELPTLEGVNWTQLDQRAFLRTVLVTEKANSYLLTFGGEEILVDKTEIDSRLGSNIILTR